MFSFHFHSPETKVELPQWEQKQISVTVKRDDLIHPYISGNKWRKLKYPIQEAFELRKNHLVTFGGAWSNHLIATACAGAQFQFRTSAFVRGEETVDNPVLALCRLFGMRLIFVDRSAYRNKDNLYRDHFGNDPDSYFIDEGGYGPLGAKGCEEIVYELQTAYNHIFVACGTGTTLAGLSKAVDESGINTIVHGVPVLKGAEFMANEVKQLCPNVTLPRLHLNYHFGGYAKVKPDLIQFIKHFSSSTGLMLEPTYTGKVFYAVNDLIINNYFAPTDKILILHTGGLTGFLGMYDKF